MKSSSAGKDHAELCGTSVPIWSTVLASIVNTFRDNDVLEVYLSAHSNSVCRKKYRVGDPPHLKNNNIARAWGEHEGSWKGEHSEAAAGNSSCRLETGRERQISRMMG